MQLNIGSGEAKLPGYINLDIVHIPGIVEPDVVYDGKHIPYDDSSCDRIVMLHVIEHIAYKKHRIFFDEVWRVLKPEGEFFLAYPNWEKCVEYFKTNYRGMGDYWLQTLYGRQLWEGDYHVAPIIVANLENDLYNCGFKDIKTAYQDNMANASTFCRKGDKLLYCETAY